MAPRNVGINSTFDQQRVVINEIAVDVDNILNAGYATTSYVGTVTSGLASVSYVDNKVAISTSGLASVSYVDNKVAISTSGLLTPTSSGSSLTGIVTSITAGSGISIDQSTGNVTITSLGGAGGENLDQTLGIGNTSSKGMSVGVVTATSFVKSGGTSSQFLKADGSVDSNSYLTSTSSGSSLTGIVTSIAAGSGISINQSTGSVTITATGGGGGGESYWVSTAAGIHTLSNVGIGTTNPTSKLTVQGTLIVSGVSTFNENVYFGDGDVLNFGPNTDLTLKNFGRDAIIEHGSTTDGDLYLLSGRGIYLRTANGEASGYFRPNGSVELYHDNSKKFETLGAGITVTGTTFTNQLSVSGVSTFQNGYKVTGNHSYYSDDVRLYFGNDSDIFIGHQTIPSPINYIAGANNIPLTIWSDNLTLGAQNGENFATFITNGSASLYYDNSKKFETTGAGVTITGTTFTNQLNVSGVSTFVNGLVLIGSATSTGTSSQPLQVTGGAYVSGNIGVGVTNPSYKLDVTGAVRLGNSVAQGVPSISDISTNAHTLLSGQGGNYLSIGQYGPGNSYAQWIQSGFTIPSTATYNIVLQPLGGNLGIGDTNPTNKLSVQGDANVSGITNLNQVTETVVNAFNTALAPSSGTLTVDTSLGTVVLGDLNASVTTWAFTNVPTANSKATTVTLIIDGDTAQTYGDACNVNGSAVSGGVKWSGGSAPTATNNFDVITFTIVKDSAGTINVFGSGNTNFS